MGRNTLTNCDFTKFKLTFLSRKCLLKCNTVSERRENKFVPATLQQSDMGGFRNPYFQEERKKSFKQSEKFL